MTIRVRVSHAVAISAPETLYLPAESAPLRDCMEAIVAAHPELMGKLLDSSGCLHRFLNVYVNDRSVRLLDGLETLVRDGDEVAMVAAIGGGL